MALLGNLTGSSHLNFQDSTDFYNGVATQSLRFEDGSSPYLNRTPAGAGNQKTWTFSAWIKPSNVTISRSIFARHDSGSNTFLFRLDQNDDLQVENYTSGAYQLHLVTDAKFRDTSAWYHVVLSLDTTQGTAANRAKLYVNGVQQTSLSASTYPSENADLKVNAAAVHRIGTRAPDNYFDGYMAEVNFVDGTQLAPTSFGETKNGVWIPIDTSGLTFGTNGFRLDFADNAVDAPESEGTEDTDNIGSDSSGEHNNWTSSGIVASDCAMPDSPENNFCTMNPLDTVGTIVSSEGNLEIDSVGDNENINGTMAVSTGKWYWEVRADSVNASFIGVKWMDGDNTQKHWENGQGISYYSSNGNKYAINGGESYGDAYSSGEIIGLALDMDGQTLTYYNEGVSQGAIDFSSRSEYTLLAPALSSAANSSAMTMNFGADSTFAGTETATSNADGNGYGTFNMAVPSGYLALCTANLPEPTIGPNSTSQADDYFETVLWTGNDTDDTAIAVNFKPDFTWIKQRTSTAYHNLSNSTVGATKALFSNATDVEGTNSDRLKAFTSTGFTLGDASDVNASSNTYVAWNWKANGGTATATISESGDNPAASVQANPTAGFSIVTYTGTGDTGTIAHGLGAVPTWILIKNREATDSWAVYHGANTAAPATDYLALDATSATADAATYWADTAPTSSVFTVHDAHNVNADGETYVAYVFADVEGYSKFGSHTGNNNANGVFVYLGFTPAFVMIKATAQTESWDMHDNARNTYNVNDKSLLANATNAENAVVVARQQLDFLSNGFKLRNAGDGNASINNEATTYIYMAFAESPFKYANAR